MIELSGNTDQEIELEVDGQAVHFTIGAECYSDFAKLLKWTRENDLWDDQSGSLRAAYLTMCRIKGWRGICLPDGQDVPCNMEAKLLFFGRYPLILSEIMKKLAEIEDAETKNSETSQDG